MRGILARLGLAARLGLDVGPSLVEQAAREKNRVVVLTGPTGVGKSSLALKLCRELDGEIVSSDSVQLYEGLDIGSNKPDQETRRATRHHLVDVALASDPWSSGRWLRAAMDAIDDCLERGKVPVVVGAR